MWNRQVTEPQQTAIHSVQCEKIRSLTASILLFIVWNVKQTGHRPSVNCCSFCAMRNKQVTDPQQTAVNSVQCDTGRSLTPSKLLFILCNVKQNGHWPLADCCSLCAIWNRQVTVPQQTLVHSVNCKTDRSLIASRLLYILCNVKRTGHWPPADCCSFFAMWNRQVTEPQESALHSVQL